MNHRYEITQVIVSFVKICVFVTEDVSTFEEDNWQNIITPIRVEVLEEMLVTSGYDMQLTQEIASGFRTGFDIGYRGSMLRKNRSSNLPLRVGSLLDLWNKVMCEVETQRVADPFESPPMEYYVQSPLGLVPKGGKKTHLIFHLSYDFNEWDRSINTLTPDELCTVKYKNLDFAIRKSLRILNQLEPKEGNSAVFYSKTDCSNAFHLAPVLVRQRHLLVMIAVHPITKKRFYFVEKCLTFGASRSCAIFQKFSDALAFLAKVSITRKWICDNPALTNYLDNFLFIALSLLTCNQMMSTFLEVHEIVGCPISKEKTEWGSPIMIFLGMLLNGRMMVISILHDKVRKVMSYLTYAIHKRKVTIKFIQQLMGILNFLNRAIVPRRAFTRGMYDKLKLRDSKGEPLKQFHHTFLSSDFIQDCYVWKAF